MDWDKCKRHFKEETIAYCDLVEENGSENTDSNMPALEMTQISLISNKMFPMFT